MTGELEAELNRMVADVYGALNRGEAALARRIAETVLADAPDHPIAFNAMGLVEEKEMNFDSAREWHARAAAADPANPVFRINHAYSMILLGDFSDAERELLAAIEIDPANASAFQNLAWIRKAKGGEPLIDRLEELKHSGDREARMLYCYALGKWYDDIGDYDRAFANYREANDLQALPYNTTRSEAFFASIKNIWSRNFLAARSDLGFRSDKPIFVVGMPRSGSTLIEQKLATDPRVAALGERPEMLKIITSISRSHPRRLGYPAWSPDLPREAYRGFGKLYFEKFATMQPDAERFVDKYLLSYQYLGFIRAMLPDALIIESRRNAVDTCLSCYFHNLGAGHAYSSNLASIAHTYRLYADLMDHWRGFIEGLIRVDYETFIEDADGRAAELRAASGLAPAESAQPTARARHVQTWSAYQVRQPVFSSSVAKWRNYEAHLGPLIAALHDLVE